MHLGAFRRGTVTCPVRSTVLSDKDTAMKFWRPPRCPPTEGVQLSDHRSVDGALGAQLIGAFKALIENPVMMLV
jgi:hypothetical protein